MEIIDLFLAPTILFKKILPKEKCLKCNGEIIKIFEKKFHSRIVCVYNRQVKKRFEKLFPEIQQMIYGGRITKELADTTINEFLYVYKNLKIQSNGIFLPKDAEKTHKNTILFGFCYTPQPTSELNRKFAQLEGKVDKGMIPESLAEKIIETFRPNSELNKFWLVSCYQQIFTFGNFSHNIFN